MDPREWRGKTSFDVDTSVRSCTIPCQLSPPTLFWKISESATFCKTYNLWWHKRSIDELDFESNKKTVGMRSLTRRIRCWTDDGGKRPSQTDKRKRVREKGERFETNSRKTWWGGRKAARVPSPREWRKCATAERPQTLGVPRIYHSPGYESVAAAAV